MGPRVLVIRVLEACDAGCFMCSFAWSTDEYRFSAPQARAIALQAKGTSLRLVRFTGGEPLLHDRLPEIITSFSAAGLLTSVITNGGLLAARFEELSRAGLSQVIVSLDSSRAESHDRYRQSPGLFARAVNGLKAVQRLAPHVRTRVNTVAGPHNIDELQEMFDLLADLGIEAWSIIPLKAEDAAKNYRDPEKAIATYHRFVNYVSGRSGPRFVGHSRQWMGRTEAEVNAYVVGGRPMTPAGKCGVVDLMRYYTPGDDLVFPCNCVPHRSDGIAFGEPWSNQSLKHGANSAAVNWLRENGPTRCLGCEPANAALGEGLNDFDLDPFSF